MKIFTLVTAAALGTAIYAVTGAKAETASPETALAEAASPETALAEDVFAFSFTSVEGEPISLSDYEGQALLVVNTATACGFRHQLEHLETLWQARKDEGLVVIGVSSNDFGGQEPRSGKEIAKYCQGKFGVSFPLADRTRVIGPDAHPFYRWAAAEAGAAPRWNFHKYVVGRDGTLISSFASSVDPRSAEMALAVTAALKARPKSANAENAD